jgi:hypothetical protein
MNAENNYRNNGQFTAGNSGRPKGSLNKSTRDAMILMEGEATQIFELIEKWQTAQSNKEKADDFKRDFPNF